jgi:hypothetical protein
LLLAKNANIGGWIIKNQRLESQSGGAFLDGRTGMVNITGAFTSNADGNRIVIDPADRSIKMINASGVVLSKWEFGDTYNVSNIIFGDYAPNNYGTQVDDYGISIYGSSHNQPSYIQSGRMTIAHDKGHFDVYKNSGNTQNNIGIRMYNLSTSPSGLLSGEVWRDGTTLRIVP